ncbi:ribosomal protein S5 domain 2-like protein [Marasmius fiardii PR-910]|nr:ribosomal protein S5 domain 2-like protein [Marasmius fiardii PR-910]
MSVASVSKSEKSYIQAGILANPARRSDGRSLQDFRVIALETGVAPLANGSARLNIGRSPHDGSGGTEVLAAVKLEVENVEEGAGVDGGRIMCSVSCSPSAYPNVSSGALDDLQHDYADVVHQTLSHPSLHPANLGIIPRKKSWLLNLDIVILADAGNVYDALFMVARAALWDTKVPRTRAIEYKAKKIGPSAKDTTGGSGDMDVDQDTASGFDTRNLSGAIDFELPDYWDEGEILDGRNIWPLCVSLNLVPPVHFLDATLQEEASSSIRVLLMFSFATPGQPTLQAMRMLGPGELNMASLKTLVKEGEKYASEMHSALTSKLREEDSRRNQKARDKFVNRI